MTAKEVHKITAWYADWHTYAYILGGLSVAMFVGSIGMLVYGHVAEHGIPNLFDYKGKRPDTSGGPSNAPCRWRRRRRVKSQHIRFV